MQLRAHGSSITIKLLLNVFYKLVSLNLMHLPGLSAKQNAWEKAKANDLEENWHTFKKVRNIKKSALGSKYRYFLTIWEK